MVRRGVRALLEQGFNDVELIDAPSAEAALENADSTSETRSRNAMPRIIANDRSRFSTKALWDQIHRYSRRSAGFMSTKGTGFIPCFFRKPCSAAST